MLSPRQTPASSSWPLARATAMGGRRNRARAWGVAGKTGSAGDLQIGAVLQRDDTGAVGERLEGKRQRELFFDLPVDSNKSVLGNSASTALSFLDETRIQVGENSKIILDKFIYDPNSQTGDVAINFSKGVFRFVTGNMQNKKASR